MIDYTMFYKARVDINAWPDKWDYFISAFNDSERVQTIFEKASAKEKHWLLQPEYAYSTLEHPKSGKVFAPTTGDEAEFWHSYFSSVSGNFSGASVCVDSTGFMRPHLMLLLRFLVRHGVKNFDVLYSVPGHYVKQEDTRFSVPPVVDVRTVLTFEGSHSSDTSHDLLVIGSGYDYPLIIQAAEHKRSARKVQMFGFPSLQPDMFQQNILMAHNAAEAIGEAGLFGNAHFFAPADDPFVVASELQRIVEYARRNGPLTNLYLCPLATKPQALGFALYYLTECEGTATSMVFPFPTSYARETSRGLSRVWKYTFELP